MTGRPADAEPTADRAAPSFRRLGPQQIAQDLLDPATEPEPLDHGLVEGGHHAPELELSHVRCTSVLGGVGWPQVVVAGAV
jgi:hypothetical protein